MGNRVLDRVPDADHFAGYFGSEAVISPPQGISSVCVFPADPSFTACVPHFTVTDSGV